MENNQLPPTPQGVVVQSTPNDPTPQVATPNLPQSNASGGGVEMKAEGGIINDTKNFFKSISALEVIMTTLGIVAMAVLIDYYRFKRKEDKLANDDMQRQVDELKMNVQSALKGKYQSI
jgi:hypothetical protein